MKSETAFPDREAWGKRWLPWPACDLWR